MKRIKFKIVLGDWSGDGHGQHEDYYVSSAKSLKEVREAYFSAKEKLPERICPENFVCGYEDSSVSDEVINTLKKFNYIIDSENFGTDELAEYVCWFINQGDSTCDLKLEKRQDDMLAFYGFDEKDRHINFIGYGLFGE